MHASAALLPHPATPCAAVRRLTVSLDWPAGEAGLRLQYVMEGEVEQLRIPPAGEPRRTDGLWRATCCELFLRTPGGAAYREFNFAPSGEWAAWQFTGRREGMRPLELPAPPRVSSALKHGRWQLDVDLPLAAEPALEAGLAAVLLDRQGGLSYWALAHAGERPDFHDPASCTLRLERPA